MRTRTLAIICLCVSVLGACSWVNDKLNLQDDHVGEELAEEIILEHTQVNIDLTPRSPEKCPSLP